MHYSARWRGNQSLRIGVAVADSPNGPFLDVFTHPMFDASRDYSVGYAVSENPTGPSSRQA